MLMSLNRGEEEKKKTTESRIRFIFTNWIELNWLSFAYIYMSRMQSMRSHTIFRSFTHIAINLWIGHNIFYNIFTLEMTHA